MSSQGFELPTRENRNLLGLRTEYWIMNPDGSGKQQITQFNQPHAAITQGESGAASDFAWSPDSTRIAALFQTDSRVGKGKMFLIEFNHPM
jgi:hypothetical protein